LTGNPFPIINSLKSERDKYMKLSKNTQVHQLESQIKLRVTEITQAYEYIKELESVVVKSKDNIIFLKDLVLGKDEKYKKAMEEIRFYKQLSDSHIAESSKLAKELISIRSNFNKMFTQQATENSRVSDELNNISREMQVGR
jgi:hypothetical protein